jgi:hypothetical protein
VADSPNERSFRNELARALRVRSRPVSERERQLARQLHQPLWNAVVLLSARRRASRTQPFATSRTDVFASQYEQAKEVAQRARRLYRKLPFGTLGEFFAGWTPVSTLDARPVLRHIIEEAERVMVNTPRRRARPSGRPPDLDRSAVSRWVAMQLCLIGIRPTRAQFSRVLLVVQNAIGYDHRSTKNVERDVRQALRDQDVQRHLVQVRTESNPE